MIAFATHEMLLLLRQIQGPESIRRRRRARLFKIPLLFGSPPLRY